MHLSARRSFNMTFKFGITFFTLLASSLASRKIPDGFMLGASSSAYQIEGAWNEDGRGPCIWDVFSAKRNDTETGYVAADSYHKWAEDVENAKLMGLNFYRFSLSWSRILPNGTINHINQKGVDYYLKLIQELKAAGIEPLVTLYHWDLPQHLSLLGGFLNPQLVDYFEDYVRLCYRLFGSYVKYWLTINEPFEVCYSGYGTKNSAPGLQLEGDGIYQCSYVLLKMHARAYRIYDKEFRSQYKGQVGIVINSEWREPVTNSTLDREMQERALQFSFGWWANPVFLGNWPRIMIERIGKRSKMEGFARSRLPQFTKEEIHYINGTHDFCAFNSYGTQLVQHEEEAPISYPSYLFDRNVKTSNDILPDAFGIRKLINFINDRYHPKAILVTENGKRTTDKLDDPERIAFIKDFLGNIIDAVTLDKINVLGYSVWSLIDTFEWGTYYFRFGLIRVDFDSPNRTRTWKKSAEWYKNLIATRILGD